jgi:signal transduction histidine kinase
MDAELRAYLNNFLLNTVVGIQGSRGFLVLQTPDRPSPELVAAWPDAAFFGQDDQGLALQAIEEQQVRLASFSASVLRLAVPMTAEDIKGALVLHVMHTEYDVRMEQYLYLMSQQLAQAIHARYVDATSQAYKRVYEACRTFDQDKSVRDHAALVIETVEALDWPFARLILTSGFGMDTPIETHAAALPDYEDSIWDIDTVQDYTSATTSDWQIITIPILTHDKGLSAILELYRLIDQPLPSENDLRPILLLSKHFGSYLERNMLLHSVHRTAQLLVEQVDELEFSRQADREISARLDIERIVRFALDGAMRRTGADAGCVIVIDATQPQYHIREAIGFPNELIGTVLPTDKLGIVGRSLREKRMQIVEDVSQDPDYLQLLPNTITQLVLPLISNQRVLGAISLESKEPGRFDSSAILFMDRIVSMTAIALDNAHLLQQAEQLADDMSLIYSASRLISSSLEWDTVVASIAMGIGSAVPGAAALVFSCDSLGERITLLSTHNAESISAEIPAIGTSISIEHAPEIRRVVKEKRLLSFHLRDIVTSWLQALHGVDIAVMAPFVAQSAVVGLVVIARKGSDFTSSEIFVTESLADQAASVMRQATLYSEVLELESLKSEMIRMASHDLRGPISNVIGYMELLDTDLEGQKNEEMQFFIDSIRSSIYSMDALVGDLLTMENIESQREEAWETIAISQLVADVVQDHQTGAHLKDHALSADIETMYINVRGSRFQLRQAMTNLVSNAIKYTPTGGAIQVKLYTKTNDVGTHLIIDVIDNGLGIPENRQERIFQRFYRAKQPGAENIPGTGLGLSMVKSIVEKHGGKISFKSVEGKGSTFTFWLPTMD